MSESNITGAGADAPELLPCPFCGGGAKTHEHYGFRNQWCISHNCPSLYFEWSEAFRGYPSEAAAIAAWNRRAPQAAAIAAATGRTEP